mmetsp:Transcript_16819/g.48051  ORF Transcript_16819/g.48051 Transcript_16819/m.48051 type:complete len:97 (-) Transcript_16819:780-1070(-)
MLLPWCQKLLLRDHFQESGSTQRGTFMQTSDRNWVKACPSEQDLMTEAGGACHSEDGSVPEERGPDCSSGFRYPRFAPPATGCKATMLPSTSGATM